MHDPMHWPSFFCGVLAGIGLLALFVKIMREHR
jgi:hypothetical protein